MLNYLTIGIMAIAVVQGLGVSIVSWMHRKESSLAKLIFSFLISAMSLTLLYSLLEKIGFFNSHPKWLFLPIYYSYSFAPLLFFYIKASLYPNFKLNWRDIKHFLLPFAQANFFFFMIFQSENMKIELWENDYSLLYGTFGYPIYLILFTIYSYFSYRFIKYRKKALQHIAHSQYDEKHAHRLEKMVKGLYFLLMINSFFIILNFFTNYLFHFPLNKSSLYRFFTDSSFSAMILWVGAYGYYRVMRSFIKTE